MARSLQALACAGILGAGMSFASCASAPAEAIPTPPGTATLVLEDNAGQRHDLAAIRGSGKSIALVFWQTWCRACEQQAPKLVRAAKARSKVQFFGIVSGSDAIVDTDELQKATTELELPFPQIRDRDRSLAEQFGITGTPTIVVLGYDGQILHRGSDLPDGW